MGLFKHRHKWKVRRTIWPYESGYGTVCDGCSTILDTGLSKEAAEASRDQLNLSRAEGGTR